MTTPDRAPARWTLWVPPLIVLAGAILRIRRVVAARSLWLDECWIAMNVITRSFLGLTKRLDFEQVAPVPFLWAVRAVTRLFGHGEIAFRLIPLLGGIAVIIVMWPLARRVLGDGWGIVALLLIAFSPVMVYFSDELKPYTWDAAITALVALLAFRVITNRQSRDWMLLWVGGAICLLCSFTAVFSIAAVVLALPLAMGFRQPGPDRVRFITCLVVWGGSFLITHHFISLGAWSPYMHTYWAGGFLGGSEPDMLHRMRVLLADSLQQDLVAIKSSHITIQTGMVLLVVTLGAVSLVRRSGLAIGVLIAGPPAMVFAASLAALYPFSSRTVLFLLPSFFLLMTEAIRFIAAFARPLWVSWLAAAMLTAPWMKISVARLITPYRREDFAAIYRDYMQRRRPDSAVYIFARALPAWSFYSTNWEHVDEDRLRMLFRIGSSDGPCFENGPPRHHAVVNEGANLVWRKDGSDEIYGLKTGAQYTALRGPEMPVDPGWDANEADRIFKEGKHDVWLLFTHPVDEGEHELVAELARRGGTRAALVHAPGATGYEYTLP